MLAGGGSICHYPVGAQVILLSGPGLPWSQDTSAATASVADIALP
jgi:hypothetical protein